MSTARPLTARRVLRVSLLPAASLSCSRRLSFIFCRHPAVFHSSPDDDGLSSTAGAKARRRGPCLSAEHAAEAQLEIYRGRRSGTIMEAPLPSSTPFPAASGGCRTNTLRGGREGAGRWDGLTKRKVSLLSFLSALFYEV